MFRNPFSPNSTDTFDLFDQMDTPDMTGISEVNNPFTSAGLEDTHTQMLIMLGIIL